MHIFLRKATKILHSIKKEDSGISENIQIHGLVKLNMNWEKVSELHHFKKYLKSK